jgi:hypothetical protein
MVTATLLALMPAPARADVTKAQCVEANTRGQDLRRDSKLSAAREQLRTCADPTCPPLVRDDCTRRLDELERIQPTIVFDAKDASGRDVSAVRVTVDGKPLAERLTGAPLQVDPGEHVFGFEVPGQAPVTQSLVIHESERDRRERIVLGGAAPAATVPAASAPSPAPAPAAPPPPAAAPPSEAPPSASAGSPGGPGMGTQKILGLTAAGLGVAGIAVGSVFGLMTNSEISQQKTDCASTPSCSNRGQAVSDHSTASTDGAISTATFIAGGALLTLGAVLFFTGGHSSEPASPGALVVVPSVGLGGGGLSLKGGF